MRVLEAEGFDPAKALVECYREAKKTYDNYGLIYDAISDARTARNEADGSFAAPTEDNAHKYLKIAADIAKDLASYAYPKLKSVEQQRVSSTEDMTAEQKLEAARMMVKILEQEVKPDDQSGTS
jgi:hypothetical protein